MPASPHPAAGPGSWLERLQSACEAVSEWSGRVFAWFTLLLVIDTVLVILIKKAQDIRFFIASHWLALGLLIGLLITTSVYSHYRRHQRLFRPLAWSLLLSAAAVFLVWLLYFHPPVTEFLRTNLLKVQDMQFYLFGIMFMAAMGYTLKHDEHVRIDIFYRSMSIRKKALVNLTGTLFFLLPVCLLILYYSWSDVLRSWSTETYRITGGMPIKYVLKTTLLVMPVLLLIQGLAELIKNLLILRHGKPCQEDSGSAQS